MKRIAVVAVAALASACGSPTSPTPPSPSGSLSSPSDAASTASSSPTPVASPSASTTPITVTYKVTGIASMRASSITFTDGQGGTAQAGSLTLPWTQQVTGPTGRYVLTAKNADAGAITCEVDVDGQVVMTKTGSGPYATSICSTPAS